MADKYIYVKLIKEWGGFRIGDVVRFGETKGRGRIDKGEGVEVPKQPAVNDPVPELQKKPKVETAMANPKGEQEVITPEIAEKTLTTEKQDDQTGGKKGGKKQKQENADPKAG